MELQCPYCFEDNDLEDLFDNCGNAWSFLGKKVVCIICEQICILEYDEQYIPQEQDVWGWWFLEKTDER